MGQASSFIFWADFWLLISDLLLETMHGIYFIQDLAVILVVAGIVGWICQRLGLSAVVGFLAAALAFGRVASVRLESGRITIEDDKKHRIELTASLPL